LDADAAGAIARIGDAEGRRIAGAIGAVQAAADGAEAASRRRIGMADGAGDAAVAVALAFGADPRIGHVDAAAGAPAPGLLLDVRGRARNAPHARVDLEDVGRLHAEAAVRDVAAPERAAVEGAEVVDWTVDGEIAVPGEERQTSEHRLPNAGI